MRTALLLVVALAGCGDSTNQADDLGADLSVEMDLAMPPDLKPPPDLACVPGTDGSVSCGDDMSCGAGTVCCVSPSGGASCEGCCASGSLGVQCTGPESCGGNSCCLYLLNSKPTSIVCTDTMQQCPPSFSVTGLGGANGQTRRCHVDADCTRGATDTQFPDCCTGTFGGHTEHFCFNKNVNFGGVTCP